MQENKIHVTLFGAGLMSGVLVEELLKREENMIHICDSVLENAQKLAAKGGNRCAAYQVDASNKEQVKAMVKLSKVSVSLLPATFHDLVADCCLEEKRHLCTASYLSPHLKSLDEQATANHLTFIGECGLDPGLDHMMAMKLIDAIGSDKVIEYESWCGGLISPEHCDNPVGYKFSWSPASALKALLNPAQYLYKGEQVQVSPESLLYTQKAMPHINLALNLEGYPNRDSLKYQTLYGLNNCSTVLRGTLRYANFPFVMRSLNHLALFTSQIVPATNWPAVLLHLANNYPVMPQVFNNQQQQYINKQVTSSLPVDFDCLQIVLQQVFSHPFYSNWSGDALVQQSVQLIESLIFFDLVHPEHPHPLNPSLSVFDNLVNHLSHKLSLKPGENDCVVLYTALKYKDSQQTIRNAALSMIKLGDQSHSAMAQTVSTPLAILTQAILDDKITKRGVNIPIHKEIYEPILEELEKKGIKFQTKNF